MQVYLTNAMKTTDLHFNKVYWKQLRIIGLAVSNTSKTSFHSKICEKQQISCRFQKKENTPQSCVFCGSSITSRIEVMDKKQTTF